MNNSLDKPDAPCVSVVIATYNVALYIKEAVRSALEQNFNEFEVIVVDDGSTDDTVDLIRSFKDPRVRILQVRHDGVAAALNRGVSAARGEFVAFLDGDDRWRQEKLERHVQFFKAHPEIDLTFAWSRIIDDQGADTGVHTKQCKGNTSFSMLLADYSIGTNSSVVVRRCVLGNGIVFDDANSGFCYDVDVWLRVALQRPGNTACIPAFLTDYRRHAGQLTRNVDAMEQGWYQLLARMQILAPEDTARVARRARSNIARYLSMIALESGLARRAIGYLRRGFCESPAFFLSDARNWKMGAALAAAFMLPSSWNRRLLKIAARRQPAEDGCTSSHP
ncbi:MAG: glycosyltransferase [Acidobacteria bacterium]|nr:glycosyltransferase [Acidobacteriota bacterium]